MTTSTAPSTQKTLPSIPYGWPTSPSWGQVIPLLWLEEAKLAGIYFAQQMNNHSKKKWYKSYSEQLADRYGGEDLVGKFRLAAVVGFKKASGLKPSADIPDDSIVQCPLHYFCEGFAEQCKNIPEAVEAVSSLGWKWKELENPTGWDIDEAASWAEAGLIQYFQKKGLKFDSLDFWCTTAQLFEQAFTDNTDIPCCELPGETFGKRQEKIATLLTKDKQKEMAIREEYVLRLRRSPVDLIS